MTADELRDVLNYDPETGVFTRKKRSAICVKIGDVAGYRDNMGYIIISVQNRAHKAHRLAWMYMTGAWPLDDIDHINGVRDDNRCCNLREATRSENKINTGKYKNNTSGYKGVSFNKFSGKWMAQINAGGKRQFIGYYPTAEEAYAAYCAAAEDLHGEFAKEL